MLNAQHLKMVQSLTLTEAYIQLKLLPSLVYSYSYQCSYFAKKKKQKWWSHTKKHAIYMDPVWDSFPFYLRTVQSQTGTKITRVGSATDTKSDRSEFVFRPVPCKHMKRNVWRAIRTHTGPSSSRSYVITPLHEHTGLMLIRETNKPDYFNSTTWRRFT